MSANGALENSVTTSDRIRGAIRPEPQYNYAGVETQINEISTEIIVEKYGSNISIAVLDLDTKVASGQITEQEAIAIKLEKLTKLPSAVDNHYSLGLPMGTSEHNSSKAPAWKLDFHNGEIINLDAEEGVEFLTGSGGLLKIPQLEVEVIYDVYIKSANSLQDLEEIKDNFKQTGKADIYTFGNSLSYITVEKGDVLVDVGELNSLFVNENFDIEVYKVKTGIGFVGSEIGLQENLEPLYFMNKFKTDEGLYDSSASEMGQETSSNVEYYFDIRVDDEIEDSVGLASSANVYSTPPNDKEPC